ncbi:hypothetical protein ACVCAH_03125 [Micromonospora sp. LZ34]
MVGRVLELRVHGVSNTPPHQTLGLRGEPGADPPRPWLVAGGPVTGFYRSPSGGPDDPVVVEAYSWGQLTSGARTARDVERALWTLLLPFTLANVALHARPEIPPDPDSERWRSRSGITAWLIRLFCLSMTGTLMLTLSGVGVDLIGWQCVDRDCLARVPGPWEFLGHGWWREGGRSLAVGLLVPLGLLTVLGLVAWRTYQYEAEMPAAPVAPVTGRAPAEAPADAAAGAPPAVPQPNFWRNTDPLGWPVTAGERDVAVRDPAALHPSAGEVADPPIRNHSGYPDAPEFHRERSRVAWLLRRAVPSPRRGFG